MNEKVKNSLGVAIIIAVFIFAGSALGYVKYYGKSIQPSSFRSFSVTAEGKAVAIPDVAEFTFSVITEGTKKLPDLQKENTSKTNAIIAYLKEQGIGEKDIKTTSYYVSPRYEYFNCPQPIYDPNNAATFSPRPCPPPEINGYTINQTVSVKIRNFDKTGEILSGAVERGANSVSQLNFTIDDRSRVEQEARAQALGRAKEKAEATARAGGFRLGRLLGIDDSYSPYPYYDQYGYARESGGGAGAGLPEKSIPPTSIEPGSQEVIVNLILRYEIE
ncbi:MAG: SIMPL domain-containing protein [bacterium]|nr:SIMPL domain-containing protein [bacterium]